MFVRLSLHDIVHVVYFCCVSFSFFIRLLHYYAKTSDGKNISEMIYFVSTGTKNINSTNFRFERTEQYTVNPTIRARRPGQLSPGQFAVVSNLLYRVNIRTVRSLPARTLSQFNTSTRSTVKIRRHFENWRRHRRMTSSSDSRISSSSADKPRAQFVTFRQYASSQKLDTLALGHVPPRFRAI